MTGFALHLLRHGALELPGRMMGHSDAAPTAEGIADCAAKAASLSIAHVISSDLSRCRLAATAIADQHALPLAIDPRWRELDFGAWEGLASTDIAPEALGDFWRDPDTCAPPGGERWSALVERVAAAVADLAPAPTLVVTHGGAIRATIHALCGFDQKQLWSFDLPYGALLSFNIWPGEQPSAQITALQP